MKFSEVEPDENYDVRHFKSEAGVWEWGIRKMAFSYQLNIGLCSSPVLGIPTIEVNYCCGPLESALFWAGFISAIMWDIPEAIPAPAVNAIFPRQKIKPLASDPECQAGLESLAATLKGRAPDLKSKPDHQKEEHDGADKKE